jgi:hypothetical protein
VYMCAWVIVCVLTVTGFREGTVLCRSVFALSLPCEKVGVLDLTLFFTESMYAEFEVASSP